MALPGINGLSSLYLADFNRLVHMWWQDSKTEKKHAKPLEIEAWNLQSPFCQVDQTSHKFNPNSRGGEIDMTLQ